MEDIERVERKLWHNHYKTFIYFLQTFFTQVLRCIIKIMWNLFLSLHWSWRATPGHKVGCIQQLFGVSPGSDLIVRNHYLIGTFVPFSHNVLSSYISLHGAYLPFFCPLIWLSYFLFQFILIASVCHYTESFAENLILAGIFFGSLITTKIDPALIPGVYTFPFIKVFPSVLPFLFTCLPLSANIYLWSSCYVPETVQMLRIPQQAKQITILALTELTC